MPDPTLEVPLRSTQEKGSASTENNKKEDDTSSEKTLSSNKTQTPDPTAQNKNKDEQSKTQMEIIVDGIRCVPVIGKVTLQGKPMSSLFHETLGCELVFLDVLAKELFNSASPDLVCDLMHIAVSILHLTTFNIMTHEMNSSATSWQPRVALRMDDLIKHIDILKFLVNQKKEKHKLHMQSLNNNNVPVGFFQPLKRPNDSVLPHEDELKCKIPKISPSPANFSAIRPPFGFPLSHPTSPPTEFSQWSHGLDKSFLSMQDNPRIEPGFPVKELMQS